MPRDADRALWLSDPPLQPHAHWRVPFLRHARSRPMERRIQRAAHRIPLPPEPTPMNDLLGRPLKNLRLSVTDRCNLRCSYCMPEAEYVWLPRQDLLQFEEMSTLVDVFARAGVDKIRITGGEPLLRRDLSDLVRMIARKPAV